MSKQENISEELLIKYLAGNASPEEAMTVDNWIDASPGNKDTFRQLLRLWSHAGEQGAYLPPNLQQEWERQAATHKPKTVTFRRILLSRRAAAAVLVILLGAACLFFLRPRKAQQLPPMLVLTATDTILRDTLPDRSGVVLSPGSRLHCPAAFNGPERMVQLEGEAYFSVTPNIHQPFIIHAGVTSIKVLGTAFNVATNKDSIVVQVDNGAVLLYNDSNSLVIKGGMQGIYKINTHSFYLTKMEDGNNYAYATRAFRFQETRLDTVARILEKAYNVKIVLENKKLANCTISTAFTDMPLEYVLEVITASLAIQYKIEGSTIYLKGNECN